MDTMQKEEIYHTLLSEMAKSLNDLIGPEYIVNGEHYHWMEDYDGVFDRDGLYVFKKNTGWSSFFTSLGENVAHIMPLEKRIMIYGDNKLEAIEIAAKNVLEQYGQRIEDYKKI
ncbi:MAG: hypothetical protein NDI94_00020 [Candidatus Woesearchaeota archaeon]|nr:hypothetical protein [Candidatus Woesearchaeota archaeon]